jgi:hypothetical protein
MHVCKKFLKLGFSSAYIPVVKRKAIRICSGGLSRLRNSGFLAIVSLVMVSAARKKVLR